MPRPAHTLSSLRALAPHPVLGEALSLVATGLDLRAPGAAVRCRAIGLLHGAALGAYAIVGAFGDLPGELDPRATLARCLSAESAVGAYAAAGREV